MSNHPDYSNIPDDQKLKAMEHELYYLRKEMEFLKNFQTRQGYKVGGLLMEKTSYKYEVIRSTLEENPGDFNVKVLCEIAGVSRSG